MATLIETINGVDLFAPFESTADESEDGVFSATLSWRLRASRAIDLSNLTADRVVGPFIASGLLPRRGTRYQNTLATCRSLSASMEQLGVYTFTATYSTRNASQDKDEPATNENPLLDRPVVTRNASIESEAIYKDRDDKPILNTAGDPVIDTIDNNKIGVTIKSHVDALPNWVLGYRNATNNAPFIIDGQTIPTNGARFVLPSGYLSEPKIRNDIQYYEFTYELLFDEQDYHHGRPLNVGFREKYDDDGTERLRQITNDDGTEVSEAVPLDADGHRIVNPDPTNTLLLTVKRYYQKDFSVLPGIET